MSHRGLAVTPDPKGVTGVREHCATGGDSLPLHVSPAPLPLAHKPVAALHNSKEFFAQLPCGKRAGFLYVRHTFYFTLLYQWCPPNVAKGFLPLDHLGITVTAW